MSNDVPKESGAAFVTLPCFAPGSLRTLSYASAGALSLMGDFAGSRRRRGPGWPRSCGSVKDDRGQAYGRSWYTGPPE